MTGLIGVVLAVVVVVMTLAAPACAIGTYRPAGTLTHIRDGAIPAPEPIDDPARSSWSGAGEAWAFVYDVSTTRAGDAGALSAPSGEVFATRAGGGAGDDLARAGAGGGDDATRVGRWMSPDEHAAMVDSGHVQVGNGGTTSVASPANAESYMAQARPGSHYVEFDVPTGSLRPGGTPGWSQIPSPENVLWGKLAPQRGYPMPQSPVTACNIIHVATKLPSC
jgi:hypothetical protein